MLFKDGGDMAHNKTILVIDDSPTVRRLAEIVLSQEGYNVLTAGDGDDGLQIAQKEHPSLIIVDFIMPKMNGFQLCKNIRSDAALNDIPIVLITSKGKDVGKGFDEQFGIVQYLQKPFEAETLTKTVKNALAVSEGAEDVIDEAVVDAPDAVEIPVELPVAADVKPVKHLDEPLIDNPFVEITSEEIMYASKQVPVVSHEEVSAVDMSGGHKSSTEYSTFSQQPTQEAVSSAEESNSVSEPDSPPADISFVEITSAEIMQAEYHAAGSSTSASAAENRRNDKVSSNEDAPVEHEDNDNEHASPADSFASNSENAVPVYAALQDSVEKEFRHYFGQELTVLLKNTMTQVLKETDLVRSSRRMLSGDLMHVPGVDVLRFIGKTGLSGKLTVLTNSFNSEIYIDCGKVVFASISMSDYRTCLEVLIMNDMKFRRSDMISVLSEARGSSLKAGSILIERGLISEGELEDCYRRLTEDAVNQTIMADTGNFFLEDMPLPGELHNMKLRISIESLGEQ